MSKRERWETIRSVVWTGWFPCMRMESTASLLMKWSVFSDAFVTVAFRSLPSVSQHTFVWHCLSFCWLLGFGKDPPDYCAAGLHEALQKHPGSPHGARAQVYTLQLDERVQALGAFTSCRVPDWRQRAKGEICLNFPILGRQELETFTPCLPIPVLQPFPLVSDI